MPLHFLNAVRNAFLQFPGVLRTAVLMAAAVAAFLLMLWILMVPITTLLLGDQARALTGSEYLKARDSTRDDVLQFTGGIALVFTARSYLLNRRGQHAQRFKDAGDQIGSDSTATRTAGIYSYDHVMRESHTDHRTIVEILVKYVRDHTPRARPRNSDPAALAQGGLPEQPAEDVQAALTVLGRRPRRLASDPVIDLSDLHLQSAQLSHARLDGVDFSGSCLIGADLSHARLVSADLSSADLSDAQLDHVNLGNADLRTSDLRNANLMWAQLEHAKLSSACLDEARFNRAQINLADLGGVSARGTDFTKATLRETNVIGADLRDGSQFHETDLTWTNLSSARLEGAVFRAAEIDATDFYRANVAGAHFKSVDASTAVGFTKSGWGSVRTTGPTLPPAEVDLI